MANYSKLIGSIIGGLVGLGLAWGLPLEWATQEMQEALNMLLTPLASALGTYLAPANVKPA